MRLIKESGLWNIKLVRVKRQQLSTLQGASRPKITIRLDAIASSENKEERFMLPKKAS